MGGSINCLTHRLIVALVVAGGVPLAHRHRVLVEDDGGLHPVQVLQLQDGGAGARHQLLVRQLRVHLPQLRLEQSCKRTIGKVFTNTEKAPTSSSLLRVCENFADGSFAALVCMLGTAAVAEEDDNKQCDP